MLDADAPSLAGPYRISGKLSGPGGAPVAFRLATEKAGSSTNPVRASVDAGPIWPALEFDGALAFSGRKREPFRNGRPDRRRRRRRRTHPLARRRADERGPLWRDAHSCAEFRFGPEERALRAEGSAALTFGSPSRLTIEAKAKQANIDAFLRRKGEDGVPPARALAMLSSAFSPALVARAR